jgi:hypothetical protein
VSFCNRKKDEAMALKRTKTAKQARTLLAWLETLALPTRAINALRRDLQTVSGEHEGEAGSGVLANIDQASFVEELYRPRGGQVAQVLAASAIEALRAAIPAPATSDPTETVREIQGEEESTESIVAAQEDPTTTPEVQEDVPADASPDAAIKGAVPEALSTATPKRRGRPPRKAESSSHATEAPPASVEEPTNPVQQGSRSQQGRENLAPPVATSKVKNSSLAAAPIPAPPQAAIPPVVSTVASPESEHSFEVLLQLWRELNPQGQRATLHYMNGLLA